MFALHLYQFCFCFCFLAEDQHSWYINLLGGNGFQVPATSPAINLLLVPIPNSWEGTLIQPSQEPTSAPIRGGKSGVRQGEGSTTKLEHGCQESPPWL